MAFSPPRRPSWRTDIQQPTQHVSTNGKPKRNRSARFDVFNHVVDVVQRDLEPTQFSVWVTLWRLADGKGLVAKSHQQIAGLVGVHRDTVKRAVAELVSRKLLVVIEKGNPRENTPNKYQLTTGT